jgi:2-keto-4-pentenoate hydratase/2-oxohepta-3-ene-1,7-dioic acid hydratase in catechol pathway
MTRALPWIVLTFALAAQAAPPELLPVGEGVTVVFANRSGVREAFAVTALGEDALSGVSLGTGDALTALAALDEAELEVFLRTSLRTSLALGELLPVIEYVQHIAGGANYVEHGAEVDVPEPFLFPKVAAPTTWRSALAVQPGWLLDYEVELAVVFDRAIVTEADLAAARAGVFLINDFTERAQLTLEADLSVPGVGGGFADAKGKPGFLPTGPFLVVPRDWRAFVRSREIRLFVNGDERQRARGADMIWSVDELAKRALALGSEPRFRHAGRPLALAPQGIARGTAILTGTPGGVAFRTPGTGFIATNAAWWAGSFAFLDEDVYTYVRRQWVEALRADAMFLRAGDVVTAEGDGLGAIVTTIGAR